jgi:hypothetical protein
MNKGIAPSCCAWMVLDSSGKPKGKRGIKPGVPVWGFTAA